MREKLSELPRCSLGKHTARFPLSGNQLLICRETECWISPIWRRWEPTGNFLVPVLSTMLRSLHTLRVKWTFSMAPAWRWSFLNPSNSFFGAWCLDGGEENKNKTWPPSLRPTLLTSTWTSRNKFWHLVWVTLIASQEFDELWEQLCFSSMGREIRLGAWTNVCLKFV